MAWYDRLLGRFREDTAKPPPEVPSDDPVGTVGQIDPLAKEDRKDLDAILAAIQRTPQERDRTARYDDFDLMDVGDIAALLDAVVDTALTFEDVATGRGFKTESDNPQVDEILRLAAQRANLPLVIEELARDLLKYGDGFVEPVFAQQELVGAVTYVPREIFRAQDDKGRQRKGKDDDGFPVAFQQRRKGTTIAGWQPWELIHAKYAPSTRLVYSAKGLLDDLRPTWKLLQLVERGMVVARITRAYPRRVHYLDVTGKDPTAQEQLLTKYISRMTKRVFGQKPTTSEGMPSVDVAEDLYLTTGYLPGPDGKPVPRLNRVDTEDPAMAGLAALDDVKYLRQKLWTTVPSDVVGVVNNQTGDLNSQDIAYTRLVRRLQRQLEIALRQIFDQALLAKGYLPGTVEYRVVLPTVDMKASWKHSDARFRSSMTLRNYLEMGAISRRWALKQAYNLSDLEIDRIWEEIGEEATNPVFAPVLPARDGQPTVVGTSDNGSGAPANKPTVTGSVNKANNDNMPPASRPTVVTAKGKAVAGGRAVTKNGVDRGTRLGQRLRGNMSGG